MQSGVAFEMGIGDREAATSPKHLRVGVNSALCSHAALVRLLMDKGVITEEEYVRAQADEMEREVERYRTSIAEALGVAPDKVDLE
jgi:hypothetical protein